MANRVGVDVQRTPLAFPVPHKRPFGLTKGLLVIT